METLKPRPGPLTGRVRIEGVDQAAQNWFWELRETGSLGPSSPRLLSLKRQGLVSSVSTGTPASSGLIEMGEIDSSAAYMILSQMLHRKIQAFHDIDRHPPQNPNRILTTPSNRPEQPYKVTPTHRHTRNLRAKP